MKKFFSIILSLCLFVSAYGTTFTTDCGNTISITATPATGYHFTQWQDGNTDNPRQVEVKSSANFTAAFAPNEYTILFVNEDGTELQKSLMAYGTMPAYTGPTPTKPASAQHNYTFAGWSPVIAIVTGDATYTATYTSSVNSYTLTLSGENGVVTGAGSYEYGSVVTISATPLECYQFKQWSDGNMNATREITITDDIELEAIFEVITYTITIESTNQEHGTVTIEVVGTQGDTPSTGIGVFSVAEGKTVSFSPGNLQYHPANDEWRFAESQTDYIGEANSNISETYNGWLDLFGWSTSSTNFGVSTSKDDNDYSNSFVDWGANQIGNDAPNTWRTLTNKEWYYLRHVRTNANDLIGVAQVNGVNGLVFLPDNWICPSGITFNSGFSSNYLAEGYGSYQTFTIDQWSKLEAAGAIFLPAAGYRWGADIFDVQFGGCYWSVSEFSTYFCFYSAVGSMSDNTNSGSGRSSGLSIRLVKDVNNNEAPDTPENTDPYNGHEYVDLGLSVKWATCNIGASKPEEYGDYFAWGEVEPKEVYDWSVYKWCEGSRTTFTKYNTSSDYGVVDNKTQLDLSDDAARANWGGNWRMPTEAELAELGNNCTWTWMTQNGVNGCKVTSKSNGNSIFLPAAGYRDISSLKDASKYGYIWSSSLWTAHPFGACGKRIESGGTSWIGYNRCHGLSVRPVCP